MAESGYIKTLGRNKRNNDGKDKKNPKFNVEIRLNLMINKN